MVDSHLGVSYNSCQDVESSTHVKLLFRVLEINKISNKMSTKSLTLEITVALC